MNIQKARQKAAEVLLNDLEDISTVALGSGSTITQFIPLFAKYMKRRNMFERLRVIPSSSHTYYSLIKYGFSLATLDEFPSPDIYIDSADEVDRNLNMLKGGGGALAREKILAYASSRKYIIIDSKKLVQYLGEHHSLPIEILPFAYSSVVLTIKKMYKVSPSLRMSKKRLGPVITDNGNYLLDVKLNKISSPKDVDTQIKLIPGVVETGLFINLADKVYVGTDRKVLVLEKSTKNI